MQNSMEKLRNLKNGTTLFGKFHPANYVMAVYDNSEFCQEALQALVESGWADEDLLVSGGELFQSNAAENLKNEGCLDKIVNCFSDPDVFLNAVNRLSHEEGYRFLLIYCPTEDLTVRCQKIITPHAIFARKYALLSIADIVCHSHLAPYQKEILDQSEIDRIGPLLLNANLPVN